MGPLASASPGLEIEAPKVNGSALSSQLLRVVLDTIPSRVFWKDQNSRYLGCNRAFALDAGLEMPEQVCGKTDFDLAWRIEAEQYQRDDRFVIESGQPKLNYKQYQTGPTGRKTCLRTSKFPWHGPDGKVFGILGVYEDITERQRAEESLREQAQLLDIAHDAITVLSLEGRVLYWNSAAEKLYGWPVEEALGHDASRLFFDEVPPEFIQALEAVQRYGEWSGELRQINRDRKPIVAHCRANLVRDTQGNPKSMLFVSTDITEKKALEARFLRVQRLETIGALASGIAHDLNNVLAPVSMTVDILRLKVRDEQEQMLLQILATSAQRGASIIRQLLTFSRGIEATRVVLHPKSLIKEIGRIVQETFPKSIRLAVEVPEDVHELVGDPTQIHQILLNLCVNARDAMAQGGQLTLRARNVQLGEQAVQGEKEARPGHYVVIEVEDTGTGMPPEVLSKIFTPFFTTKPVGKGTGLGLATVRDLAHNHNGFVQVRSQPGSGSRFLVFLPVAEPQASQPHSPESSPVPLGRGELVLVVDDEQYILKLARHILEAHGYRMIAASDGREALDLFARHKSGVRAAIIDMIMPTMDGATTVHILRSHQPRLPILMMSGTAMSESEAWLKQERVTFLPKPFTTQHLLAALDSILTGPRLS